MALTRPQIRKLDKIWADVVKTLASYRCEHCRLRGGRVEAAHVVGRRHRTTRWGLVIDGEYDLAGHCLCHRCHQEYDEHGPMEQDITNAVVGLDRKDALQFRARTSVAKHQDFDEIKQTLDTLQEAFEDDAVPIALRTLPIEKK